jgi:predicted 2-oxoglutarate/Fe(II)-dependent dioxygenase YbiX
VLAVLPLGTTDGHIRRLVELAQSMPLALLPEAATRQAPVLMVPRVFEPGFCARLIAYYRETGSEDSGFMRDQDGKTVGVYDYGMKRRRDCTIEDEALRQQCMLRIHRRLVPEIERAYQYRATRMERYIVACYEGEHGGHFRAHRDNTTRATAHRRFAVSLNLNADYEGGELCFPEYGAQRFRPSAGEAVVFSCSMLHEATPVTRGTRYVFLPFLYDDAAAALREEGARFLGGNINAPPA